MLVGFPIWGPHYSPLHRGTSKYGSPKPTSQQPLTHITPTLNLPHTKKNKPNTEPPPSRSTTSTPQLPFKIPHTPANRDHKAVSRGTLGQTHRVQVSLWHIHEPQSHDIVTPFKAQVYTISLHGSFSRATSK